MVSKKEKQEREFYKHVIKSTCLNKDMILSSIVCAVRHASKNTKSMKYIMLLLRELIEANELSCYSNFYRYKIPPITFRK